MGGVFPATMRTNSFGALLAGNLGRHSQVTTEPRKGFSQLLYECVCYVVKYTLGEDVLDHFLVFTGLDENRSGPKEVRQALCLMFKDEGATVLEKRIIKMLFRRQRISFDDKAADLGFDTNVERARKDFEKHVLLA